MGFQEPQTIKTILDRIQTEDLVLPAIQREFVWGEEKIARLFDSIMRGYPIGTFLSWKITPPTTDKFRWYGLMKDFHRKENIHCPLLDVPHQQSVVAVLDGQQRLSSLNIGLRGSFAERLKYGRKDNSQAYPKKLLYLNLLAPAPPDNELRMEYDFRFLEEPAKQPTDGTAYWFPVHQITRTTFVELAAVPAHLGVGSDPRAATTLAELFNAVHNKPSLTFFEEPDQDVEKVLDIFIRVNSGGEPLSYSDLLLSIATAQWETKDARDAVYSLVDELNGPSQKFRFSKNVVLKAGLVLLGVSDIGFKVRNFNKKNMLNLEQHWDSISNSLEVAAGLLADFGLSEGALSAESVLIPIAYYVHLRKFDATYRTNPKYRDDRQAMRNWVIRSLVKQGVWGSGLDTLLRDLREGIQTNGATGFPVADLERRMATRGKPLTFTSEEIDDILGLNYGASRTFGVLALLSPYVDTTNVWHVDHIYPRALLTKARLRGAGLDDATIARSQDSRDLLPNLQLLPGPENISKQAKEPEPWARATYPGDAYADYLDRNQIPRLPTGPKDFVACFDERRDLLKKKLAHLLGVRERSFADTKDTESVTNTP